MKLLVDYKPGDKVMLIEADWFPYSGWLRIDGYLYRVIRTIEAEQGKYLAEVRLQA